MLLIVKKLSFLLFLIVSLTSLNAVGWLGITISEPSEDVLKTLGQKELFGVQVDVVEENSPAEKAGIQVNDLILKIDGDRIYTTGQLKKMILSFEVGTELKLNVLRDGKEKQFRLLIEEKIIEKRAFLGVVVSEPEDSTYESMGTNYGLEIDSIIEGSEAEKAGLKISDVILRINDEKVYTVGQLSKMISVNKPNDVINLTIYRGGKKEVIPAVLGGKAMDNWNSEGFGFNFFDIPNKVTVFKYNDDYDRLGLQLEDTPKGIIVKQINEDSEIEKTDIKVGDKIVQINDKKVSEISQLDEVLAEIEHDSVVELSIISNGKKRTIKVKAGAKSLDNAFDLTIDDEGVKININGDEKMFFDKDKLSDIQKYFDEMNMDEVLDRIKDRLPDENDFKFKYMKTQTNKEKI
jgi:S1-C subfamily serine protease